MIVLNTCAIREHAEARVLGRLGDLGRWKAKRPSVRLGVTGCMAQRLGPALLAQVLDHAVDQLQPGVAEGAIVVATTTCDEFAWGVGGQAQTAEAYDALADARELGEIETALASVMARRDRAVDE